MSRVSQRHRGREVVGGSGRGRGGAGEQGGGGVEGKHLDGAGGRLQEQSQTS